MSVHSGQVTGLAPSLTVDNWILDAAADEYATIVSVNASGEVTAGAAVQAQVSRAGAGVGAGTAGDEQPHHPHGAASAIDFFTDYATTQPTVTAGALIQLGFNANGGSLYIITDPNARPEIVGVDVVTCRNILGSGAGATSSYGVVWAEP